MTANQGDPVLSVLPGRSRYYLRSDPGREPYKVPSVTTVTGLTPKPYLMNWVVKLAAEYAAQNVMDLYYLDLPDRVQKIKDETRTLREEGAKKGTALHEFAEQYLWLGPPAWPWEPNHAEQAVMAILALLKPTVLATEVKVWNGTVGYAGTIDGLWRVTIDGREETWLVDWKTSKSRTAEWVMQLLAYRNAETLFLHGREYLMPKVDRLVVLWTPYEGDWQVLPMLPDSADWEAFLAAHQVLRWTKRRRIEDVYGTPLFTPYDSIIANYEKENTP